MSAQIVTWIAAKVWAVSVEIAALIVIIWIVERLCWKASSLFRYWLWLIVLVRLCIPVYIAPPEQMRQFIIRNVDRILSAHQTTVTNRTLPAETPNTVDIVIGDDAVKPEQAQEASRQPVITPGLMRWLPFFWFAVVTISLLVLIVNTVRMKLIIASSFDVDRPSLHHILRRYSESMHVRRKIGLFCVDKDGFGSPMTSGFIHPKIIIPLHMSEAWTNEEITPLLLHELAHIKRYDIQLNWLMSIVQAFFFFHPAVWLANKRFRELREDICDDIAIHNLGGDRALYTKSILKVMESITYAPTVGALGLGVARLSTSIGKRVQRIMSIRHQSVVSLPLKSVVLLAVLSIVSIAVAGMSSTTNRSSLTDFGENPGIIMVNENGNPIVRLGTVRGQRIVNRDIESKAVKNLVAAINQFTDFDAEPVFGLSFTDKNINSIPFIYVPVTSILNVMMIEPESVGNYLAKGGFIVFDNSAKGIQHLRINSMLQRLIGDALDGKAEITPIPQDHELYHLYFDFPVLPNGKIPEQSAQTTEGIMVDGRLAGLITNTNLADFWGAEEPSEPRLKLGINFVAYSLQQKDGIYRKLVEQQMAQAPQAKEWSVVRNTNTIVVRLTRAIKKGSGKVLCDGKPLVPGTEYTIDYAKQEIILQGYRAFTSQSSLQIQFENEDAVPQSVTIKVYDDKLVSSAPTTAQKERLPLQARIEDEDGSSVYFLKFN